MHDTVDKTAAGMEDGVAKEERESSHSTMIWNRIDLAGAAELIHICIDRDSTSIMVQCRPRWMDHWKVSIRVVVWGRPRIAAADIPFNVVGQPRKTKFS